MAARDLSLTKGIVSGTKASACRELCGAAARGGAGAFGCIATVAAADGPGGLGAPLCRSPIRYATAAMAIAATGATMATGKIHDAVFAGFFAGTASRRTSSGRISNL